MLEITKSLLQKLQNVSWVEFVVWHKGMEVYWDKKETPDLDESELDNDLGEFWYTNGGDFMYSGTLYLDSDLKGCTYERENDDVHLEAEATVHACTSILKKNIQELSKEFEAEFDIDQLFLAIEFKSGVLVDCRINYEKEESQEYELKGDLRDKIAFEVKAYIASQIDESFLENMSLSIYGSWLNEIKEVTKESFSFDVIDDK